MRPIALMVLSTLLVITLFVPGFCTMSGLDFNDNFETANFGRWDGKRVSAGERITIVTDPGDRPREWTSHYMACATSNGNASVESAFCYKKISASQLYAFGYFNIARSGIVENDDRFYLIVLRSGSVNVAYAGVRKVNDVLRWTLLVKNGTGSAIAYSSGSVASYNAYSSWQCVELFWRKDVSFGGGELWVNDKAVCSLGGRNTAVYGNVTEVQFGLPAAYSCGSIRVDFDDVKISNVYTEPYEPWRDDTRLLFDDGFEFGLSRWDRVVVSAGGTAKPMKSMAFSGLCSGMFTYYGSGQSSSAACSKNVRASSWLVVKACVRVAACSAASDGARFYMIKISENEARLAYVGWKRVNGVLKWCLCAQDGTRDVFAYSTSTPVLNKWYTVELSWLGADYWSGIGNCIVSLKVNGNTVCSINGKYEATHMYANRIDFGLPLIIQFTSLKAYFDNFSIDEFVGE